MENGSAVSYTVPQRIRPAGVDRNVKLFFRVNRVFGKAVILVRSGETQIACFKREHMAPGEMESVILPKTLLPQGGVLTVSAEEVEA